MSKLLSLKSSMGAYECDTRDFVQQAVRRKKADFIFQNCVMMTLPKYIIYKTEERKNFEVTNEAHKAHTARALKRQH
jgi:predicted ATPase